MTHAKRIAHAKDKAVTSDASYQPQFKPQKLRLWRRDVFRELQRLGVRCGSRPFSAGMVLAAIYGFGTDVNVIAEVTGYTVDYVKGVLKRLRKTRVLVGQTLRVRWNEDGFEGQLALCLDALVAAGEVERPVDPKRSLAQRQRQPPDGTVATRRRNTPIAAGAVFTPAVTKSNPLYQIAKETHSD